MQHDLVIENGLVVDGSGAAPRTANVAVTRDRITAVTNEAVEATRRIDATGQIVTPGFVDVHTHLDAQLWWDPSATPSSWHGVTTVVMGNCGVTFAPCRPEDRTYLAEMMESVEDIPARSILDGLPWDWNGYDEFLSALGQRRFGVNVGGLVGHCAVRHYAMGKRSQGSEAARSDEQASMEEQVRLAMSGGALGFSTSRTDLHIAPDGTPVPGTYAPLSELEQLAAVVAESGHGILGVVTRLHEEDGSTVDQTLDEIERLGELSLKSGLPLTFNLTQGKVPDLHERILEIVHRYRDRGARLRPQTTVRPIGWLYGFVHRTPFDKQPAWRRLRGLDLATKLERLKDPAVRAELIDEAASMKSGIDLSELYAFPEGPARYDLGYEDSLQAHADRRGVSPGECFIDLGLESEGTQIFTWPVFNARPDAVEHMLRDSSTMLGLADAGAHVGQIMDASQPSYVLSHWVKERGVLTIEDAIHKMTADPAETFGIERRGRLQEGYFADVNVIDLDAVALHHPEYVHDFPGGAGRFVQRSDGYSWTLVNGVPIREDGNLTGDLPGVVVTHGGETPE